LELTRNQDGETIARELKYVLDNLLITNLDRISNSPQGALDDKLDPDQERIGAITVDSKKVDILLHQVPSDLDPAAKIWLFSAATLKQIPALDREVDRPEIEKYLPPIALVHTYILHLRLWQLVAFVLVIPVSFLISGLFTRLMKAVLRPLIQRITHEQAGQGIQTIGGPVKLIVWVLVLHTAAYSVLALPVLARQILIRIVSATSIAAAAWLLSRIIELTARLTQERMMRTQQQAKTAVVHLVRRLLKAVVGGLAILFILQSAGINLTAVVAGVSVVGIAVAFAAQKTLENLFGGMMIITDEPVRVGDVCRFGSELGTVEDIGIRSTRIRTMGRSVVAVPNGQFSAMSLENLSVRDKILFNPTIGLRGETSADQLRFVLAEIRRMLYGHPKVETATARVRFVKFGDSSLDVEVFAYVPTQDNLEFLAVREDLLLRIMDIVETGGSGLANPSQTVYLGKDSGLNAEKSRIAAEKVDQWRKQNALPFPDFGPGEIAEISNKIPYPDPESAQRED
jgi:MscS family membrane protein